MSAIFERELKGYFRSVTGYIFTAFILLFAGIYTMVINLSNALSQFEYVLSNMSFVFIIAIPVLTMRVIAEERRQKTDQLLYALPMSMNKIVLGKYFAMLAVLAVPVVIMMLYPLLLSFFGPLNYKTCYAALLGFFLLGAALAAVGMFISSLTENQVIAAVICVAVMLLSYFLTDLANYVPKSAAASFGALLIAALALAMIFYLLTHNGIITVVIGVVLGAADIVTYAVSPATMEGLFPKIMQQLSVFDRFYTLVQGVFDVTALVYLLAVCVVFVYFTVQAMEKRRWS